MHVMSGTDAHGAYKPLLCDIRQNLSNSFNAPKLRPDYSAVFIHSAVLASQNFVLCDVRQSPLQIQIHVTRQTEAQAQDVSVRRVGSPKAEFLRYASNVIFQCEHIAPPVTVGSLRCIEVEAAAFLRPASKVRIQKRRHM